MQKIYIALSDPQLIVEYLKPFPNLDYQILSKEDLPTILEAKPELLIVEEEFITLTDIYQAKPTNLISFLGYGLQNTNKDYPNVKIYEDITEILLLLDELLSNHETNHNDTEQTNDLRDTQENETIDNTEAKVIYSKPQLITNPYPQRDEGIYTQMKTDIASLPESSEVISHFNSYEYEQDPLSERAVAIRKGSFSKVNWDRNKTIGVWSPLSNIGVTTFVINFSIYLAQMKVPVGVIEALNNRQILKTMLEKYGSEPIEWHSFIETLYEDTLSTGRVQWVYKGVHWMPLGDTDFKYQWNQEALYHYLNNAKYFDLLLVDLPTGEMKQHTLDTLNYIDELWIIVDDAYHHHLSWKSYIHKIIERNNLTTKLIFNNEYPFSKVDEIAKKMELDLLATLPALHEECQQNHYEPHPLIHNGKARSKLKPSYDNLIIELLGPDFMIKPQSVFQQIKRIFHSEY